MAVLTRSQVSKETPRHEKRTRIQSSTEDASRTTTSPVSLTTSAMALARLPTQAEHESNEMTVNDIEECGSTSLGDDPDFWFTWKGILDMRSGYDAPVDSMGCDKLADPLCEPKVQRFHHLVAAFLSSQTTDQSTSACMNRLKRGNLTVDVILSMEQESLEMVLRGVSFHKTKAKNLKKIAEILKKDYHSDIPQTYQQLCALPGIGPKMALLILSSAWNRVEGIAVDVHVHRIANRLGWIHTKTPQQSCITLSQHVPKPLHKIFNSVLVGFGQQRCKAVNPLCSSCLVRMKCSYGQSHTNKKKVQRIEESNKNHQVMQRLLQLTYTDQQSCY